MTSTGNIVQIIDQGKAQRLMSVLALCVAMVVTWMPMLSASEPVLFAPMAPPSFTMPLPTGATRAEQSSFGSYPIIYLDKGGSAQFQANIVVMYEHAELTHPKYVDACAEQIRNVFNVSSLEIGSATTAATYPCSTLTIRRQDKSLKFEPHLRQVFYVITTRGGGHFLLTHTTLADADVNNDAQVAAAITQFRLATSK